MMPDTTTKVACPPYAHAICPHCGGAIALAALTPAPLPEETSPAAANTPVRSPAARLAGMWLDRLFPITRTLRQAAPPATIPNALERRQSRLARWALMAAPLILVAVWLLGHTLLTSPMLPEPVTPSPSTPAPTRTLPAPEEAALLAVVAQYNAAEPQVGATLALDPIRPLLDDRGPLLVRRAQELARRKQSDARHATRLLRWAVGAIAIDTAGTTATLVTREIWENQEAGAVAPQTATVRVTYTLRRSTTQAPWRIADAIRTLL